MVAGPVNLVAIPGGRVPDHPRKPGISRPALWRGLLGGTAICLVTMLGPSQAQIILAQSQTARLFSRTQAEATENCSIIRISFTTRVQYQSHFPLRAGDDLVIKLRFVDPEVARSQRGSPVETAGVPRALRGVVDQIAVALDTPATADLRISFASVTPYEVSQGKDLSSIVVTVFKDPEQRDCAAPEKKAEQDTPPTAAPTLPPSGTEAESRPFVIDESGVSQADKDELERLVTEARDALTAGDNQKAIRLLSRAVRMPETHLSPEAQELLGVARERNQQLAHAKAEYEIYLERFPNAPDAPRVRQRLAALLTAGDDAARSADSATTTAEGPSDFNLTWGGSVAQTYFLDNTVRTVTDPFFGTTSESDLDQNELQSNVELFADFTWGDLEGGFQFSGANTVDFTDNDDDETSVSEAYVELRDTVNKVGLRVGRQSRNTAGVLGRFDGGLAEWEFVDGYEVSLTGGFPVRDKDKLPETDTAFAGAAVQVTDIAPGLDVTGYGIFQHTNGLQDRRALGVEARYFDDRISAFGGVEYDIFFDELNNVYLNGTYTFEDSSTLNASFDYRNAPVLETANALQGQPLNSLEELKQRFTDEQIYDLAKDRTATVTSGSVGYTRPLDDQFQIALNGTVSNFSGTPASGGVPATPSTGVEYFVSGQLTGTDLIRDGDLASITLRYSDTSSSRRFNADLRTRYPIERGFRISPSIGAEYRTGTSTDFTETAINGTIGADYSVIKGLFLEAEVGGRYAWRDDTIGKSSDFELFAFVGYRYDF